MKYTKLIFFGLCIVLLSFSFTNCGGGGGGSDNGDGSATQYSGNWSEADGDTGTFIFSLSTSVNGYSGAWTGSWTRTKFTNEGGSTTYSCNGTFRVSDFRYTYEGIDSRGRVLNFATGGKELTPTFPIESDSFSGSYYDPSGGEYGNFNTLFNPQVGDIMNNVVMNWADMQEFFDRKYFEEDDDTSANGSDIQSVKFSTDNTKDSLYILIKLSNAPSQNLIYRMFLDERLSGDSDDSGNIQVDFYYTGSEWRVDSQRFLSNDNYQLIDEKGTLQVNGNYLAGSVNLEQLGLKNKRCYFNLRSQMNTNPYAHYDYFGVFPVMEFK